MAKSSVFLAISYTKRMKVENSIKKYLETKGLEVITGRDATSGRNLCAEIINLIKKCDFGVVVYNELRHNISYEWGLMDALEKDILLLKDENTHIDLDKELSDKKAVVFTPFFGEDTQEEIIEQLKKDKGLEKALKDNIEKRISQDKTPNAEKAAELLVKSDLGLGNISSELIKELPNSQKIIEALEKIKTLTAEGHLIKGNALSNLERYVEAIECYDKALVIDPKNVSALNNKGTILNNNFKRHNDAIECFDKILEIDPKYLIAWYNKGTSLNDLKRYNEAIICFNKALEINPKYSDAWSSKGKALDDLGQFNEALKSTEKAIESRHDNIMAWFNKGIISYHLKRYKQAIQSMKKVTELRSDFNNVWYYLASFYSIEGEKDNAISCLRRAIEISPAIKKSVMNDKEFEKLWNNEDFKKLIE